MFRSTAAQQLIQLMAITPGKLQTQSSAHALVIGPDTTPAKYLSRLLIYAVIALGTGEGYLNTQSFMPESALARAPVHFAEQSFNSLVENGALNGHARVDWASVAIGTGIDVLDDYLTYKEQQANASACAASIISRVDQQFGTQAQQVGDPWYSSTGAPYGTGTMNLNISR